MTYRHIPAMPAEVLHYLNCRPGGIYVDGTVGGCGHARAICERMLPGGLLIGIDQDQDAVENAKIILADYGDKIRLFYGNFDQLPGFLNELAIPAVDGILIDLGLSLHHIENSGRGFSFNKDEPLDMRMDVRTQDTAADLVNNLTETNLRNLFHTYGEERWAKQIARRIVRVRKGHRIGSSRQLAQLVSDAIPAQASAGRRIHPATRVFMALRIAVNRELDVLENFLGFAVDLLNPSGRLCVLAFHSLEDRLVKQRFKTLEKGCTCPPSHPACVCGRRPLVRILTKKPVRPDADEVAVNPMARSTRLRAVEKI
jgi:16S rRNA (cytosine1402-N4)-methyltransferase